MDRALADLIRLSNSVGTDPALVGVGGVLRKYSSAHLNGAMERVRYS